MLGLQGDLSPPPKINPNERNFSDINEIYIIIVQLGVHFEMYYKNITLSSFTLMTKSGICKYPLECNPQLSFYMNFLVLIQVVLFE